ncbi:MucR family transcriptional regulator [Aureimonas glaciei]|uniref:MucR family transcriptional regulator n=1 Tax=Aureimonas glaciei TaxID=1776957 RepID=A0A917DB62_9HYPH|nr:MucR family transcriptional regulator [Aureimonas glaciei]GGD21470.1 MucR family transcriptional regulator [Aureimonas glaciei]
MTTENTGVPMELVVRIVAAYVGNNHVGRDDLGSLIQLVHSALNMTPDIGETPVEAVPLKPAVSIKKSITPDYIICLEDGKSFKSLKRHLASHYDLTPDEYRRKWGLPSDYPMVAANYSAQRSQLAKSLGLGRKAASEPEQVEEAPKRRATRKTKASAED